MIAEIKYQIYITKSFYQNVQQGELKIVQIIISYRAKQFERML